MAWQVAQYERFRGERARPFHDLLARVPERPVARALDLGCGTGELTQLVCARWPAAAVVGVDSSEAMLAAARPRAAAQLTFVAGDAATYATDPVDLLVSNAVIQWIPDHAALLTRWAALLAPGGTLAVQLPANFTAPSHLLLDETAAAFGVTGGGKQLQPLDWYVAHLMDLGFQVDAWDTEYLQLLGGDDAVLEWMKGTALTPYRDRLPPEAYAAFVEALRGKLRAAYPATRHGTFFPFKRRFFVATLAASASASVSGM